MGTQRSEDSVLGRRVANTLKSIGSWPAVFWTMRIMIMLREDAGATKRVPPI